MDYDLSLIEWITIGLHKKSLAASVEAIRGHDPLPVRKRHKSSDEYIEKVLREEIFKQFSDYARPMLEVILNAVDARPAGIKGTFPIDVRYRPGKFSTSDSGASMDLDQLLRLLIIPFSTEKKGIEEIGRFGVGFLSTFNYCIMNPGKAHVLLDASSAQDSCHIDFYAVGQKVPDVRMRIAREAPRSSHGTKVRLAGLKLKGTAEIKAYLGDALKGIHGYRAAIAFNKKQINDVADYTWFNRPVTLDLLGKEVAQDVHMRIEGDTHVYKSDDEEEDSWSLFSWFRKEKKPKTLFSTYEEYLAWRESPQGLRALLNTRKINITSQGVSVKSFNSSFLGATVSFPSGVMLVEGRDEFKIDDNYRKAVETTGLVLQDIVTKRKDEPLVQGLAIDFIPELLAAFDFKKLSDMPNIEAIRKILLPGKEYIMRREHMKAIRSFFMKDQLDTCFIVAPSSYEYWREFYGDLDAMIARFLAVESETTPAKLSFECLKPGFPYPNLYALSQRAPIDGYERIVLARMEPWGRSMLLEQDGALIVNVAHPHVQGPMDPTKGYHIVNEYVLDYRIGKRNIDHYAYQRKNDERAEDMYDNLLPSIILKQRGERWRRPFPGQGRTLADQARDLYGDAAPGNIGRK